MNCAPHSTASSTPGRPPPLVRPTPVLPLRSAREGRRPGRSRFVGYRFLAGGGGRTASPGRGRPRQQGRTRRRYVRRHGRRSPVDRRRGAHDHAGRAQAARPRAARSRARSSRNASPRLPGAQRRQHARLAVGRRRRPPTCAASSPRSTARDSTTSSRTTGEAELPGRASRRRLGSTARSPTWSSTCTRSPRARRADRRRPHRAARTCSTRPAGGARSCRRCGASCSRCARAGSAARGRRCTSTGSARRPTCSASRTTALHAGRAVPGRLHARHRLPARRPVALRRPHRLEPLAGLSRLVAPTVPSLADDLDLALRLAERAAAIALAYFEHGVTPTVKGDGTPVTEADVEVERALLGAPGGRAAGRRRPRRGVRGARRSGRLPAPLDPRPGRRDPLVRHRGAHVGHPRGPRDRRPARASAWSHDRCSTGGGGPPRGWAPTARTDPDPPPEPACTSPPPTTWRRHASAGGRSARRSCPTRWPTRSDGAAPSFDAPLLVLEGSLDPLVIAHPTVAAPWDHAPHVRLLAEAGGRFRDPDGGQRIDRGHAVMSNGRLDAVLLPHLDGFSPTATSGRRLRDVGDGRAGRGADRGPGERSPGLARRPARRSSPRSSATGRSRSAVPTRTAPRRSSPRRPSPTARRPS